MRSRNDRHTATGSIAPAAQRRSNSTAVVRVDHSRGAPTQSRRSADATAPRVGRGGGAAGARAAAPTPWRARNDQAVRHRRRRRRDGGASRPGPARTTSARAACDACSLLASWQPEHNRGCSQRHASASSPTGALFHDRKMLPADDERLLEASRLNAAHRASAERRYAGFPGRWGCELGPAGEQMAGSVDGVDGESGFGCRLDELHDVGRVGDHRQMP